MEQAAVIDKLSERATRICVAIRTLGDLRCLDRLEAMAKRVVSPEFGLIEARVVPKNVDDVFPVARHRQPFASLMPATRGSQLTTLVSMRWLIPAIGAGREPDLTLC